MIYQHQIQKISFQKLAVGAVGGCRSTGSPSGKLAVRHGRPVGRPEYKQKQIFVLAVDWPGRPTKPESKGQSVGRPDRSTGRRAQTCRPEPQGPVNRSGLK